MIFIISGLIFIIWWLLSTIECIITGDANYPINFYQVLGNILDKIFH